jgi:HK97 family phage portal protein
MGLLDRVSTAIQRRQSWPLGPGTVEIGDESWGHSQDMYAPSEYGDYIATSNGVYTCVSLRARLLASLPLRAYRMRPRLGKEAVDRAPVVDLLAKVNPYWTLKRLINMTEMSLGLWGHCPWFIERGTSGKLPPREIFWGRPDRLRPLTDPDKYIKGYLYQPQNSSEPLYFGPDEVVWIRYPNPLDEFAGLSPLAAARLSADYGTAAMRANKSLFEHGLHMGGMISLAEKGQVMTETQAREVEALIDKRYKGTSNAHRWIVMRAALNVQGLSITPKDADFLGGLKQSLEDICRAYGVPLDLAGGERTYQNVDAALRAIWTLTLKPEADFIAAELTEMLLPMFGSNAGADLLEFDTSEVEELKEEETETWTRWKEQIAAGTHTINEWRQDQGLAPVEWGDVWWAPGTLSPIENAVVEPPPAPIIVAPAQAQPPQLAANAPATEGTQPAEGEPAAAPAGTPQDGQPTDAQAPRSAAPKRHGIAYGSEQHRAMWDRFVARSDKHESRVGSVVADLFKRQQESILAKLHRRDARTPPAVADVPFDKPRWIKEFRTAMRPQLRDIVAEAGQDGIKQLGLGLAFDVVNPEVTRFIEKRAQRFAQEVNATTYDALKQSLAEGIEAGEDMDSLANRVESVMGDRIASSKEVVARTEVLGSLNGGTLLGWNQAQDLVGPMLKHWLAALDSRTRDDHRDAHARYADVGIPLEDNFKVGDGEGLAPGQIGLAEQDCNCR